MTPSSGRVRKPLRYFNALFLRSDDLSLRLHASILLSERNSGDPKCPFLAEAFGADPDFTSHPTRGCRESGHGPLHFLDALRAENEKAGSLSEMDFTP